MVEAKHFSTLSSLFFILLTRCLVSASHSHGETSYEKRAETVSCTQSPTGANGIGITVPCGTSAVFSGDPLGPGKVLTSQNGVLTVTLRVKPYLMNATAFSFYTRAYCIDTDCSVPGPTLKFYPGDRVVVTVINDLGAETITNRPMNALRLPNTTNLHTHGLHVDPNVDDVMVEIPPGGSHVYNYSIPTDHLPGTHWYHDHLHGSSVLKVMGGLLGALVVDYPPSSLSSLPPSYTAMTSHVLVLSHHPICSCNPTTDPFRIRSMQEIKTRVGDAMPLLFTPLQGGLSDVYLTNGQYQPYVTVRPGEWRRFDIVNAVGDTFLEIQVLPSVGGTGTTTNCLMRLMALDGVIFRSGPRTTSVVLFAPASRASVAVMCSSAGTYYLQSNPLQRASDYEVGFLQNLLTLQVSGTPVVMDTPSWTTGAFTFPSYLSDLTSVTPVIEYQVGVDQTAVVGGGAWLGVGKNCTLQCTGRNCPIVPVSPNLYGECPYVAFGGSDMVIRHIGKVSTVEDVVIQGRGRTPHPLHIHVNHFQIISAVTDTGATNPVYSLWGNIGDWRDTMPALAGTTRARYMVDRFSGPIILHCHFLFHEDTGMMERWYASSTSDPCTASGGGDTGTATKYCSLSSTPAPTPSPTPAPTPGSDTSAIYLASVVFSYSYYLGRYTDLTANGITTEALAKSHWLNYGITEGRRGSAQFDPPFYLGFYPDLTTAFGAKNYKAAITHFVSYGQTEGRIGCSGCGSTSAPTPSPTPATDQAKLLGTLAFDYSYYLSIYPDLTAHGVNTQSLAQSHWLNYGIAEGRRGSPQLNPPVYLARYPDLSAAFGSNNYKAAIVHFVDYGFNEGRTGA